MELLKRKINPEPVVFELPMTRDYVRHWGLPEAVREILQNQLDGDSPFEYFFEQSGRDTWSLTLSSRFTVLEPHTLVLGATGKAGAKDKIGSFGEGYKLALLVLLRIGKAVTMYNGPHVWRPSFERSATFNIETLHIRQEAIEREQNGLEFFIDGLTEHEVQAIRDTCLHMQKPMTDVIGTPQGMILPSRKGQLFIGGLFVCNTKMHYGYDVKPEFLALERDRQTVSDFNLAWLTKDMWLSLGEHDRIAAMMDRDVPDVAYIEYNTPDMIKEACYKLFKQKNPGKLIAKTQEEANKLVARGLITTITQSSSFYTATTQSRSYRAENVESLKRKTPHEELSEWYEKNQKHMPRLPKTRFKEILELAKGWNV